jgi:hypothetical protein
MSHLDIAPETLAYLDHVEGETFTDKILSLIAVHFATQLYACEKEIRGSSTSRFPGGHMLSNREVISG